MRKIRDEWDFKSIEQGIEQIIKFNTASGRQLKNDLLSCSCENLGKNLFKKGLCEAEKQLNWIAVILNNLSDDINTYLRYRNQYENALLLGDYDEAKMFLDKIEEEVCVSLWGNRIVLYISRNNCQKSVKTLANNKGLV